MRALPKLRRASIRWAGWRDIGQAVILTDLFRFVARHDSFRSHITDRRTDRHRRRRSRRLDGPGSAARGRHRRGVAVARTRCRRSRQSVRSAQSMAAAERGLSASESGHRMEPRSDARGGQRTGSAATADPARRRSFARHRFDQRGGQTLPRHRQAAAHPVARRARRFQHLADHAVRQPPRHAGVVPVRAGSVGTRRTRRSRAGDRPDLDPPDRHPLRRRRRKTPGARQRPRHLRHALHRRSRHAAARWKKRSKASTRTRICT